MTWRQCSFCHKNTNLHKRRLGEFAFENNKEKDYICQLIKVFNIKNESLMKRSYLMISILVVLSMVLLTSFSGITESVYRNTNDGEKATKDTTDATLDFTVRTTSYGGNYAPKHVLAIWIKDNVGNFVKSLMVRANNRKKHLVKWVASSNYNEIDAITGATLNSHTTHTVSWNCTDVAGNTVPDDDYQIWVEFTNENSYNTGNPGPFTSITFTKGNTQQLFNPPDEQYFKDMIVDYFPTGVSIFEKGEEFTTQMEVFPNPIIDHAVIVINLDKEIKASLEVFDISGKLINTIIKDRLLIVGDNEFVWNVMDCNGKQVPSGIYNITLISNTGKSSTKIVISR